MKLELLQKANAINSLLQTTNSMKDSISKGSPIKIYSGMAQIIEISLKKESEKQDQNGNTIPLTDLEKLNNEVYEQLTKTIEAYSQELERLWESL